jgi:hypothetical protein
MEDFVSTLQQRGVTFTSSEQAVALGNAVADILQAFGGSKAPKASDPQLAGAVASVREWLGDRA